MIYTDVKSPRKNQKAQKMINKCRLKIDSHISAVDSALPGSAAAQDAAFPCNVLLCSQANWPTIFYCVPNIQEASLVQMLGIAVEICQQAIQQARQKQLNQSAVQSTLAANTSNEATSPISCPNGSFPVSQVTGGYTINSAGSTCGTHTSSAVESIIAFQCLGYTDVACSVLFKSADLTIINPPAPAPAPNGLAAGQ
jgi:hypothetical protein